jgi:hypothetical protein
MNISKNHYGSGPIFNYFARELGWKEYDEEEETDEDAEKEIKFEKPVYEF